MTCFKFIWNPLLEPPVFGFHRYAIPNPTACPKCDSTFGMPSINYPWIDAEEIFSSKDLRAMKGGAKTVTWERYQELSTKLRHGLRKHLEICPVPPATYFGPYECKLWSAPPPVSLSNIFSVVVWESVAKELAEKDFKFRADEVLVVGKRQPKEKLFELWAPPVGEASDRDAHPFCESCERGLNGFTPPLARSSIPEEVGIFRLRSTNSRPIVTDAFWEVLSKYQNKHAVVDPLEVV